MNLASHNSFSYLPVTQWRLKPFAFTARCQRDDIGLQEYNGVRLFDLRVRFDKFGNPIICHGLIQYKHTSDYVYKWLRILNTGDHYIRVVLETNKTDKEQESRFKTFCEFIAFNYRNIQFFGGNNRTDWRCENPIYDFGNPLEDIDHKYSSTTSLFPEKYKWLRYIDDLCPIFYARRYNKKNIEAGTTHKWLMIDFVDIR